MQVREHLLPGDGALLGIGGTAVQPSRRPSRLFLSNSDRRDAVS